MKKIFSYIFAGIIILGLGYFYGLPIIKQKIGEKQVENLAEALKKIEEEDYKLALADTYGGKTPQETLDMFIEAVEKGDYELASKYFVIPKQEEELNSLNNSDLANIKNMISILKKLEIVDLRAGIEKMYEEENKKNSLNESREDYVNRLYQVWNYDNKALMKTNVDGYDFDVDFWRYPSGNWKIQDF